MSFNAYETSAESGSPCELFEFKLGAAPFRYTTSQDDVTILGATWQALPIARGPIVLSSGDTSADRLEVDMPGDVPFINQFILRIPGQRVTFTLRRFHRNDPDQETVIIFKGAVLSVSFIKNGRVAVLQVAPSTVAKGRPVPRFTYQGLCNHMLYDERCKVSEHDPSFEKFLPCTATVDTVLTLTGAGGFGLSDFFEQGFVEFDGDFRLVVGQSGDDLTLLLPFVEDPTGHTLRTVAGCKARLAIDCRDKFNNVDNYGGFAFVPQKNPFQTGIGP